MQYVWTKSTVSAQQMHDFLHSKGYFEGRKGWIAHVIKAECPDNSKIFAKVVTTSKNQLYSDGCMRVMRNISDISQALLIDVMMKMLFYSSKNIY